MITIDYTKDDNYQAIEKSDSFHELPYQIKLDLINWFNCDPDADDMELLLNLYLEGNFRAWNCPDCGERVYDGTPDNWNDFQATCNQDFTSYPGNTAKYKEEYLVALCDRCRMKS